MRQVVKAEAVRDAMSRHVRSRRQRLVSGSEPLLHDELCKGAAALFKQLLHVTSTHLVPRRDGMHGEVRPAEIVRDIVLDGLQPGHWKTARPSLLGCIARRS